tara:strand:+ start:662 stop:2893 length:2232 start_codon:yes stop_codon:yes gene_type:complete
MLTNQDRRAILEQVRASESQDIIAALRGQVSPDNMQSPVTTPEPVVMPQQPQPIDNINMESVSAVPSNLVDSTISEPTQLAAMGGFHDFPNMIGNDNAPWELKKGLRRVESSDGVNMINPNSTATGYYGQLYSEVKDLPILENITRDQFASDTTLQNKIFDMRYRGEIPGIPGLKDNAEYLSKTYSDVTGDLTFNEIAALSNLTGRQGAIDYFRSLRHGTEFKLPGVNKTPEEYIETYRSALTPPKKNEIDYSIMDYEDGGFKLDEKNQIDTYNMQGYDETELFNFIKDKYTKIDTSRQQQDLLTKLESQAFRDRYKKNIFNITGENLSDEELTSRISDQIEFTGAGAPFMAKFPYVTRTPENRRVGTTPMINPFGITNKFSGPEKADLSHGALGMYKENPYYAKKGSFNKGLMNIPEFGKYTYLAQLADVLDTNSMRENDVLPSPKEGSTIIHEYAHSYNTDDSPLFRPAGSDFRTFDRKLSASVPGDRYKSFLTKVFGEDYFNPEENRYGRWSMRPEEISSIRAENEAKLKKLGVWDANKNEFTEKNLDKLLKTPYTKITKVDLEEGAPGFHLNKLGYGSLVKYSDQISDLKDLKKEVAEEFTKKDPDFIKSNITEHSYRKTGRRNPLIDEESFNTIFNNSQSELKDRQKYNDYKSLVSDFKSGSKREKKRASKILDNIFKSVNDKLNTKYDLELEKLQELFDQQKKESLPKFKMYFNEIAMNDNNKTQVARTGGYKSRYV